MKILIIGSSGAGKSTFSRQLSEIRGYPVLHLDKVWHKTDYSDEARDYLRLVQREFLAAHENCIVDGNYSMTLDTRLAEADLIVWMKIGRIAAIRRVLGRTLHHRLTGRNRSDMATNFKEKIDKEYWGFLKFIWNFPQKNEPRIQELINKFDKNDKLVYVRNRKDKEKVIQLLKV
ncbi:MAG: adenylate kinase [Streptococcaceae bacterium]|jgi:adenylate kinase family enzyme|nr:adenylate kinase [Streptococcaceae bacterium]